MNGGAFGLWRQFLYQYEGNGKINVTARYPVGF
jgi:hypothetical protein